MVREHASAALDTRCGRMVATILAAFALMLAATAAPAPAQFAPTTDQVGSWGPILNWATMGKHMAVLPTGKVLVWSTGQNAHVWDPATGQFKATPATFGDLHCAGHVTLADGSVFVIGGVNVDPFVGIKVAATFDPVTETWTNRTPMKYARWYPTATTLSDGSVLATSGTDAAKAKVTIPEVYDPATDTWRELTGASRNQPIYPFMYQLPNGRVYDAAPKSATASLDVSGSGSWSAGPTSGWDNSPAGCCSESGAMYDKGKIIRSGGGDPAHARTGVVDMTQPSPQWREVEQMAFPRRRHNMVVLADGSVLAVGGTRAADDVNQAVLAAERWDPATEQWDTMASMSVPRMYHSAAVMLPDGRVVAAAGDNPSAQAKLTAQIYSPPYLFKGVRPAITSSPAATGYGSSFSVGTDTAGVQSVALIRPGSATHAIDMNQRYVPLDFTQSGSQRTVTGPANGGVAPPGAYMLIIENGAGVPSVASWIRVGSGGGTPPPTAPTAAFTASPTSGPAPLNVSFTSTSTGSGPLQHEWDFQNDGTVDSTAANPQFTYASAGAYDVRLRVRNAAGSDDELKLGHIVVGQPSAPTPPTAGFSAAPTTGTAPLGVSFTNSTTGTAPMSFEWDFQNDGTVDSTEPNPTFTYASAGTYSVRLRATNSAGADDELKTGLITVNPPASGGTTLTFGADADARVQEANATTNYGSSYLRTDGATDPDVESYLRFTVSGASAIASAKLRVYATSATGNGPAVYTATNTTWSESAITWGNRPQRTTTPAGDKGGVGANSWVEFDVSSLVSGNGSYTFVLATDSTDGLNMNSREATSTTLRPQLVVQSTAATAVPTADFTASPTSGVAPLTVTFTDQSTGATSWAWDFHDDDSFETTDRNPTFTYTQPGTYTVRL